MTSRSNCCRPRCKQCAPGKSHVSINGAKLPNKHLVSLGKGHKGSWRLARISSNFPGSSRRLPGTSLCQGTRIEHKLVFLKLFRHPGISRQNSGVSRKVSLISWFRGTYRTFWPPPLHMEDPYRTGKYRTQTAQFSRRFREGISFPNFVQRSICTSAPLQALCCALCSTEQTTFRGGEQGEKVPRKGAGRGAASRGGKKEKRTREIRSAKVWVVTLAAQCEIPPHIAQHPSEIVSQRGYRTHLPCFHRVSREYR